ncbi:TIGR02301 family protein [Roseibium sp.]|uniref:TIGR02301 family protein n=1 Tax=Roseibium sp. TaxID=1936156 RepID=UPI002618C7D9|nr:TIGR02301 family protein [Roseibium sp.]
MKLKCMQSVVYPATLLAAIFLGWPGRVVSAQEVGIEAPPYEQQLMRLSEIFGALHFLRPLCNEIDSPSWRDQMEDFLDAETIDENRRRRFIERFNQGYRGFSVAYRECTDAARIAMGQYLTEGETIISDVTSRYGR